MLIFLFSAWRRGIFLVVFRCCYKKRVRKVPIKTFFKIADFSKRELFYRSIEFSNPKWWRALDSDASPCTDMKKGILTKGFGTDYYEKFRITIDALEGGRQGDCRVNITRTNLAASGSGLKFETITLDQLFDELSKQLPGDSFRRHIKLSLFKHLI